MPKRHNPLKPKTVHRGTHVNAEGGVKALCYGVPRAIDLTRATWTNRDEAVTCPKCRRIIASAKADLSLQPQA
jgi:hypothetical protein